MDGSAAGVLQQSLRGFLAMVERDYPEEILRIRAPVRVDRDITSLVFELERAGRSPVVVYENVEGHSMPIVTNIAGNRRLLAACLGVDPAELPTAFRERCQKYIPCDVLARAPWQDIVLEGDQVDLGKLPIPLHFRNDAAPYITAGQIAARDPVTGVWDCRCIRAGACMNSTAAPSSAGSIFPPRSLSASIPSTTWVRWPMPIRRT
jgi:UbiD family decarboxylase